MLACALPGGDALLEPDRGGVSGAGGAQAAGGAVLDGVEEGQEGLEPGGAQVDEEVDDDCKGGLEYVREDNLWIALVAFPG